jgi:hypothetical protein
MSIKSSIMVAALTVIAVGTVACSQSNGLVQQESLLDKNWGRSYESAKYNQILNPNAGKNLDPVMGMDGVAADNSVNKYDQSFKEKSSSEVTNILKLQ